MNDHEAERIAAAMHQLRPDWPAASVLTLIRNKLMSRPRRDVTVALSWVACDSNSHTPARVLETGPWWKAAAAEVPHGPSLADKGPWCKNCGLGQNNPIHASGECVYTLWPSQILQEERKKHMAELRAAVAESKPPPTLSLVEDEPHLCGVNECIRAAGHTGPHLEPPPTQEPTQAPEAADESGEVACGE